MEKDKTTILAIIVGLAGLLAEFVFHTAFSSSAAGMILGAVLAVAIIVCAYCALDGIYTGFLTGQKKTENRRREFDEKLFRMLEDKMDQQIRLEKAIYVGIKNLSSEENKNNLQQELSPLLEQLAENVNEKTVSAAKLVAGHGKKDTQELLDISRELLSAVNRLEETSEQILIAEQQKRESDSAMTEKRESLPMEISEENESPSIEISEENEPPSMEISEENEPPSMEISEENEPLSMEMSEEKEVSDIEKLMDNGNSDIVEQLEVLKKESGVDMPEKTAVPSEDIVEIATALSTETAGAEEEKHEEKRVQTALEMFGTAIKTEEELPVQEEEEKTPLPDLFEDPNKIMSPDDIAALLASMNQ